MRALAVAFALLVGLALLAGCGRSEAEGVAADELPTVTVFKTPTCGCCSAWADHMEEAGFPVRRVDVPDLDQTKRQYGVPPELASCHTGVVGPYVVEGHVPAEDVKALLAEQPDAAGLAVPAMPIGSPGMEVPGREPEPYEVYLFTDDGRAAVFSRH